MKILVPAGVAFLGALTGCNGAADLVRPFTPELTAHAAVAPSQPRFTSPPFAGNAPLRNWFDHNTPQEGSNTNGFVTTTWGERVSTANIGVDGHSGYDWSLPTGTPIRAVAAGTVTFVGTDPPFLCSGLGRVVSDQRRVILRHAPGLFQPAIESHYVHLDNMHVTVGQQVTAGMRIGESGSTGCALGPHLHFEVRKVVQNGTIAIDPYGWTLATTTDPWSIHSSGTASINLWAAGVAPARFREERFAPNAGGFSAVVPITAVQWMGVDDRHNPNNEYIELTLDPNVASTASLNGFQIRGDKSGFTYNVPPGITLTTASPTLRIHSGVGVNTATQIFMGRTTPMWSNAFDDCARRVNTNTNPPLQYVIRLGAPASTCSP
ncbi:MAG: peptidoglycan DD-metalloendopeptidase family protein [Gemmatimonadetes bacterium]|nr:peptidoglycan DD-metalloendopeptidase family protein [Gemmatimonadota bacterium]